MDASLKELMSLVREVNPESRKKGTYFDFAIGKPYDQKTELLELIVKSFAYLHFLKILKELQEIGQKRIEY